MEEENKVVFPEDNDAQEIKEILNLLSQKGISVRRAKDILLKAARATELANFSWKEGRRISIFS